MPALKLTKASIDRLPNPNKTTLYFDAQLTDFLRARATSPNKTYGVAYRAGSGQGAAKKTLRLGITRS